MVLRLYATQSKAHANLMYLCAAHRDAVREYAAEARDLCQAVSDILLVKDDVAPAVSSAISQGEGHPSPAGPAGSGTDAIQSQQQDPRAKCTEFAAMVRDWRYLSLPRTPRPSVAMRGAPAGSSAGEADGEPKVTVDDSEEHPEVPWTAERSAAQGGLGWRGGYWGAGASAGSASAFNTHVLGIDMASGLREAIEKCRSACRMVRSAALARRVRPPRASPHPLPNAPATPPPTASPLAQTISDSAETGA